MPKRKELQKQQAEMIERNQKEKERILQKLESENIQERSAGEVLQEFTKSGWPMALDGLFRMVFPLKARYDLPKFGSSVYPEMPSPAPIGWEKLGMRYQLEFNNGQCMTVVVLNDGTIGERTYTDKGDIHINDVRKFLKGWQKSVNQTQHGGLKPDPKLLEFFERWKATNFDTAQKAIFRKQYIDAHTDKALAHKNFDQAMKYYKGKHNKAAKSLASD